MGGGVVAVVLDEGALGGDVELGFDGGGALPPVVDVLVHAEAADEPDEGEAAGEQAEEDCGVAVVVRGDGGPEAGEGGDLKEREVGGAGPVGVDLEAPGFEGGVETLLEFTLLKVFVHGFYLIGGEESVPQALKREGVGWCGRAKPEGLAYLEAARGVWVGGTVWSERRGESVP